MIDQITEAIAITREGDAATERAVIGGVLVLLSPLVVPAVVLVGYLLRVLLAGVRGAGTLPDIHEWKELGRDGAEATAVIVAFGVPFYIVAAGLIGMAVVLDLYVLTSIAVPTLAVLIVALLLLPVLTYPVPAALAGLGIGGDISDAFDRDRLKKILTTKEYRDGIVAGWVLLFGGAIVGGVLSVVLVGFAIIFVAHVAAFYIFGQSFTDAADAIST